MNGTYAATIRGAGRTLIIYNRAPRRLKRLGAQNLKIFILFVIIYDSCKVEFERSAADKSAVYVGLGHKSLAVARVHRAAVLYNNLFCALGSEELTNLFADIGNRLFGLLVGGRPARAYCPYGFVCYNYFGNVLNSRKSDFKLTV